MSSEGVDSKRKKGPTWAEAARTVLEMEGREMTHKEILKHIQLHSLKDVRVKSRVTKTRGNASLACLNAMLHHHSRTANDYFYKVEGKMSCYGINRDRVEISESSKLEDKDLEGFDQDDLYGDDIDDGGQSDSSSSTVTASSTASTCLNTSEETKPPTVSPSHSSPSSNSCSELQVTLPRVSLTTSVTLTTTSSRQSNGFPENPPLVAGPKVEAVPTTAINSLPVVAKVPKKRGPKPRPQSKPTVKKPRMTVAHMRQLEREKAEREKLKQVPKLVIKTVPPTVADTASNSLENEQVKYVAVAKSEPMEVIPTTTTAQSTVATAPGPSVTTIIAEPQPVAVSSGGHPLVDPSFANNVIKVPKKRYYKKMSIATQMKRTKEGRIDLQSPDSILTTINLKNLVNESTFSLLPQQYQTQLLSMFPLVDIVTTSDGEVRPSPTALSNEFFTSACQLWKERLMDGEFTPEVIQKLKQDEEKQAKRDPWKEKYFEQVWGEKSLPLLPTQILLESQEMKEQLAAYHSSHPSATTTNFTIPKPQPPPVDLDSPNIPQPCINKPTVVTAPETSVPKTASAKRVVKKALTVAQMRAQQQGNRLPMHKPKQIRVTASRRAEALKRVKEMQAIRRNALMNNIQKTKLQEDINPDDDSTEEVKLQSLDDIPVQVSQDSSEKPHSRMVLKSKTSSSQANTTRFSTPFRTTPSSSCSCQLKAMTMCRKCGAFCHSDCMGSSQQQLCTLCVVN